MVKPLLYTTREAAQCLGIGRTKLFELLAQGRIPAVRLGSKVLISVDALKNFVDQLPPRDNADRYDGGGQ